MVFTGILGGSTTFLLSGSFLTPMEILTERKKHNVRYDARIKFIARGSPLRDNSCPGLGNKLSRGIPLGGMSCGDELLWLPQKNVRPTLIGVHPPRRPKILPRVPPYGRIRASDLEKQLLGVPPKGGFRAVMGCYEFPCAGAPNPDRCPSAPATQNFANRPRKKLLGFPLTGGCCAVTICCCCPCAGALDPDWCPSSREKCVSRPQPNFSRGPPLGGKVCWGGVQFGRIPAWGSPAIIRTHK